MKMKKDTFLLALLDEKTEYAVICADGQVDRFWSSGILLFTGLQDVLNWVYPNWTVCVYKSKQSSGYVCNANHESLVC